MKFTATAGLLASVALWTTAAQAEETVLSALPEQVTAWVENFNPFNQTTAAPSVMHFMYEPLIIFKRWMAASRFIVWRPHLNIPRISAPSP